MTFSRWLIAGSSYLSKRIAAPFPITAGRIGAAIFDYYLTTKVLENGSETRKEPPQNVPESRNTAIFRTRAQRQFTPVLSLVRTRSPVQIWLAAPETTVSDLLTVVFFVMQRPSPSGGLGGGVQAKRNRAPMSYLPGVPENTEYFWGETGHQFKIWLAAPRKV